MSANVSKKTGDAVNGGTRGVEGATPARAQSPESAGVLELEEVERIIYRFIKQVALKPEDYPRIERELRDGRITIYGRSYKLLNSADEIQKILELPWDAPIKVKASITSDKIRLNVYSINEVLEQKVVEEKKLQGLRGTLLYKLIRSERKVVVQNIFTGERWEESISVAGFDPVFEDFAGGRIPEEKVPDYLGIKVVECKTPTHFKVFGLQKIYVFNDGTIAELHRQPPGRSEGGELEGVFGSLDTGGGSGETLVFVFNKDVDWVWKIIYTKAVELYHRREAEEYTRQREQWKKEIEEAQAKYQQKTETIIHFLKSRKNGFITKEEIEWLKTQSPTPAVELHVYRDPFENIEVLWLGGEVSVKVGREEFRIPVKEVA